MTEVAGQQPISFILAVTGHSEAKCVARMIRRALPVTTRRIEVEVVRRVPQRPRIQLRSKNPARSQVLPDHQRLALDLPKLISQHRDRFFIWLDDLENGADRNTPLPHFNYYRELIDRQMTGDFRRRCSVHFLANMLENYFFGDAAAVNSVLGTTITDHDGDCENIRSAAGKLDQLARSVNPSSQYHKTTHGVEIAQKIQIERVVGNARTCRALRTLVGWCWEAMGELPTDTFQLVEGVYWDVTSSQLANLPASSTCCPLDAETGYVPSST